MSEQREDELGGDVESDAAVLEVLLSLSPVEDFLQGVVDQGAAAATGSCALSVAYRGGWITAASSDDPTAQLNELHYGDADAPFQQAVTGKARVIATVEGPSGSGAVPDAAARKQTSYTVCVPLLADGTVIGVLSVCSLSETSVTAGVSETIQRLAEQAAGALAIIARVAQRAGGEVWIADGLAERSLIDTAIGVLMARDGHDPVGGLDALTAEAQRRGVPLAAAAERIVGTTTIVVGGSGKTLRPAPDPLSL